MTEELEFMNQLLADAELEENKQSLAYYDLLAREIMNLEEDIEAVFQQSERECEIIREWALKKNAKIQEYADQLRRKLQTFMRVDSKKTLDLPHAVLKLHKKPDRAEVTDLDLFLSHANADMVTVVPEAVKPSLAGIKKIIKMSGRVPPGVELISGKEEFTITFKNIQGGVSHDSAAEA